MSALTDDELLERLGECLLADAATPDARQRAALHRVLDEAPAPSVIALHTHRPWRRIRRPVAATIAATILLSGSAAAAVETNTLPGPLRSLAVTLGLPVTPSAFTQAQSALSDLTRALAARDPVLVRADLTSLEASLSQLSPSDRAALGPGVVGLIAQAEIFLASQPRSASDDRASAVSRGGDGSGGRESPTDDATGAHAPSGGAEPGEPNDSNGSASGSPATTGPGAPTATTSSGQPDGDDVSGGVVAPSPTGSGVDGGTGTSDGGSTTSGTTSTSDGSDGSGTSGGSDGSSTSGGSDGGSGGTDGGGYVS